MSIWASWRLGEAPSLLNLSLKSVQFLTVVINYCVTMFISCFLDPWARSLKSNRASSQFFAGKSKSDPRSKTVVPRFLSILKIKFVWFKKDMSMWISINVFFHLKLEGVEGEWCPKTFLRLEFFYFIASLHLSGSSLWPFWKSRSRCFLPKLFKFWRIWQSVFFSLSKVAVGPT